MYWLAMKMLLHQKMRLLITLIGIAISVVLALVEVAIYLGMMGNATSVIRHTPGDMYGRRGKIRGLELFAVRINSIMKNAPDRGVYRSVRPDYLGIGAAGAD